MQVLGTLSMDKLEQLSAVVLVMSFFQDQKFYLRLEDDLDDVWVTFCAGGWNWDSRVGPGLNV